MPCPLTHAVQRSDENVYGENENLKGPNGEPYEAISTVNKEGDVVRFDHHKWGHEFKDAGEYVLPHFHGPDGEHISYPKPSSQSGDD